MIKSWLPLASRRTTDRGFFHTLHVLAPLDDQSHLALVNLRIVVTGFVHLVELGA